MGVLWRGVRAALFQQDAERVHERTVALLQKLPPGVLRQIAATPSAVELAPVTLWGRTFRSAVGLAAGFDKNGALLPVLPELGFGFAEIGTVTPKPQPGNPKPRLFRIPDERALFNRMGFNNEGAEVVAERLRAARSKIPGDFPIGVNLGKNKDTSLEDAPADYARAAAPFDGLADYLVVNISSPNTPGLRALQGPEAVRAIVGAVMNVIAKFTRTPPLLLKLAPELGTEELGAILRAGDAEGVSGWILTNTLAGEYAGGPGGWSGAPVCARSRAALALARSQTARPLISVGGILSPEEARDRVRSGANLVQVYSGWILEGPRFPGRVARALKVL